MSKKFIKTNKRLKESDKGYKGFIENMNVLAQSVNSRGEFVYVNKKWRETLGYTKKDLKKINLFDILRKDQVPHCKKLFKKVCKGEKINTVEAVFISKRGKEIVVEGNITPNFEDGKFIFIRGIFSNITARKEAENKIKESEEKYKTIFNISPEAIIVLSKKGNVLDVNDRLYDWLGYRSEEVIGKNLLVLPFLSPKSKILAAKNLIQRIAGKEILPYELEFIAKNGERMIGLINATPIRDEKGKIVQDLVMITNITELKKIGVKLKESEEKFKAIAVSAQDAIIMIDNEGNVNYWNEAAERMFDYEKNEIIGKQLHSILAPSKYYEAYSKGLRKFGNTGIGAAIGKVVELSALKKDGTEFPMELSLSSVMIKNKWNAIGIIRDITERKKIDQMKTEFVSIASHQLKTPLTAISWFTEILSDEKIGELNKQQKEFLKDIYASTKKEIKLVNNLLNVSRLEGGTIKVEPKKSQYENIVNEIIRRRKLLAEKRKCALLFKKPKKKLPLILLDRFLLKEVIDNLVTNAIRYSEPRSQITIRLEKRLHDYLLTVVNKGIGIPKEEHGDIFKKFFRANNARKKEQDGSGLGLYIAKTIIESSGGKIWFDSEKDKGAKFYLSIPLKGMESKKGNKKLL